MTSTNEEGLSRMLREVSDDVASTVIAPTPPEWIASGKAAASVDSLLHKSIPRKSPLRRGMLAAACAVVLAMSVIVASTGSRRIVDYTVSARTLLASLAITASHSVLAAPATEAFYYTRELGGGRVEGDGFSGMVQSSWRAWYQPPNPRHPVQSPGSMSQVYGEQTFVSGHGRLAWVQAGRPSPVWVLAPSPAGGPREGNEFPLATPYPTTGNGSLSDLVQQIWEGPEADLGLLGGYPGPDSIGRLVAGLESVSATVRAGSLRTLSHFRGVYRLKNPDLGGGPLPVESTTIALVAGGLRIALVLNRRMATLVGFEESVENTRLARGMYRNLDDLKNGEVISWARVVVVSPVSASGEGP